jgi:serine/threonine protein kinase
MFWRPLVADGENGSGSRSRSHYFALPGGSRLYEFEIEALLGHGGFGITYRATDTLLQETVAIKEFLPNELAVRISDATVRAKSGEDQPDFDAGLKSFLEEARMMARFRHPRIVHVRRFFELHGTGYIVLDYERGQTLSERLSEGPIPDPEVRSILSGVLDGLEVIHARAILHRDLKPNNVMLREDGAPVIIDFGAARDFQGRHSRSITAIATAGYAPPEQYGVGGQQGPWSDLYALGAIAYRAVSGVSPMDSLRRLRKDPLVPAVVAGAGKYDEALLRTIDWMLQIDEADRPTSVAQVREALRGGPIAEAGPEISRHISAKAQGTPSSHDGLIPTPGTRNGTPSRRGRVAAIVLSLLVLAGLTAGSYAFYVNYQTKQRATQEELEAKQQAERQIQQANERQRLLAEQLASAGTDQSKLEQFLTACGSTCPDDLRTQAQTRIDTVKQQQQAELARQDEVAYRAARGDLAKLRAYDTGCKSCAFRDANTVRDRVNRTTAAAGGTCPPAGARPRPGDAEQ